MVGPAGPVGSVGPVAHVGPVVPVGPVGPAGPVGSVGPRHFISLSRYCKISIYIYPLLIHSGSQGGLGISHIISKLSAKSQRAELALFSIYPAIGKV